MEIGPTGIILLLIAGFFFILMICGIAWQIADKLTEMSQDRYAESLAKNLKKNGMTAERPDHPVYIQHGNRIVAEVIMRSR